MSSSSSALDYVSSSSDDDKFIAFVAANIISQAEADTAT